MKKVQSKKDQFIIKLKNTEQTQCVKDYYCPDNNDSWIHFHFAILHDDLGKYSMLYDDLPDIYSNLPVISFEEWQRLPDVPKPEYDPKDVSFKPLHESINELDNGTEKSFEFGSIKPRKVVGYKLIKPEYKEASRIIIKWDSDFEILLYNGSWCSESSEAIDKLEKSGVLPLWFEPVYDTSITLKSGVKLSEDDIAEVKELIKMRKICEDLANEKKY